VERWQFRFRKQTYAAKRKNIEGDGPQKCAGRLKALVCELRKYITNSAQNAAVKKKNGERIELGTTYFGGQKRIGKTIRGS